MGIFISPGIHLKGFKLIYQEKKKRENVASEPGFEPKTLALRAIALQLEIPGHIPRTSCKSLSIYIPYKTSRRVNVVTTCYRGTPQVVIFIKGYLYQI